MSMVGRATLSQHVRSSLSKHCQHSWIQLPSLDDACMLRRHGVMPSSALSQAPSLELQDALARQQIVAWHGSQTPHRVT